MLLLLFVIGEPNRHTSHSFQWHRKRDVPLASGQGEVALLFFLGPLRIKAPTVFFRSLEDTVESRGQHEGSQDHLTPTATNSNYHFQLDPSEGGQQVPGGGQSFYRNFHLSQGKWLHTASGPKPINTNMRNILLMYCWPDWQVVSFLAVMDSTVFLPLCEDGALDVCSWKIHLSKKEALESLEWKLCYPEFNSPSSGKPISTLSLQPPGGYITLCQSL